MTKPVRLFDRVACYLMPLLFLLPAWSFSASAQASDQLREPVYPVIKDKAFYDQFEFDWYDLGGAKHTSKVSDPATDPLHMIALMSYVYANPAIPGTCYAIPDSAGMNPNPKYKYKLSTPEDMYNISGFNGRPIRANNLSTDVDYERNVDNGRFTGDVLPGASDYDFEYQLSANQNGLDQWRMGTYIGPKGAITEFQPEGKVQQPIHGLTVFLVKLKDLTEDAYDITRDENGNITKVSGKTINNGNHESMVIYTVDGQRTVSKAVYDSFNNRIAEVRLLTNAVRIEDTESKNDFNSGTLYNITDSDLNHFYFIAKGSPRQSRKMPSKPLFEEFSPISSLLDGYSANNFHEELMSGKVFTMQHDCSSVPENAHGFSMHGLCNINPDDHRSLSGVSLWIPDYRMRYWRKYTQMEDNGVEEDFRSYHPKDDNGNEIEIEGLGRDLFKYYGSGNDACYRVIRYFNYNPMHQPTLALYSCQLHADAAAATDNQTNHLYDVTLDWATTVSKIAGNNEAIPEDFEIYRVVDGVREATPLFTFIYNEGTYIYDEGTYIYNDGTYCKVNIHHTDLADGSAPSSKSRSYETSYQVPQYPDHGYWITYQVFTRIHKDGDAVEVFEPVYSNLDKVWIPPYQNEGVQLHVEANTSSTYYPEKEVNRYVNTVRITNNPDNPILRSQIHTRSGNNSGWDPNANDGMGDYVDVDDNSPYLWRDNHHGSEIIVYRYNREDPSDITKVAQIYFHDSGTADGKDWYRFDVRRHNQLGLTDNGPDISKYDLETAIARGDSIPQTSEYEDLYVYKPGYSHPWMQRCVADNHSVSDPFPFTNRGYALGISEKGDPNYDYSGIMITDVFEVDTKYNAQPDNYVYKAEFHEYRNDVLPIVDGQDIVDERYPMLRSYSNEANVDVYKSNSESSEHTFTKTEIDDDTHHNIWLGYKAGVTVTNMLYLPEVEQYDIWCRLNDNCSKVNSHAKKDTQSNYIVYSNGNRVDEPSQFQAAVTIPDLNRVESNLDHIDYVPVITANLPDRAEWLDNVGTSSKVENTYGSNYHGTDNTKVKLDEDEEHPEYETYLRAALGDEYNEASLNRGAVTEHATSNGVDYYGHFMQVNGSMSRDLEVYGVRVWRVRAKNLEGLSEDVLVNEWFEDYETMDMSEGMPKSCYFVVTKDQDGLRVAFKDAYPGPDEETYKADPNYQATYIAHFYGRLKSDGVTPRRIRRAGEATQEKIYYASEARQKPDASSIVTAVDRVMATSAVSSVQYIDIMGRVSHSPFKGLNIVVTHYVDGTTTTSKLFK